MVKLIQCDTNEIDKESQIKKVVLFSVVALMLLFVGMLWSQHSSPSLSSKRALAYQKIVVFASKHKDWGNFDIDGLARLRIRSPAFLFDDNLAIECCPEETYNLLGRRSVNEAQDVVALLNQTSTQVVRRQGRFLLFYPEQTLLEIGRKRFGYVYSLDGTNPDQSGSSLIERSRPFESMGNNWYYARRIAFAPLE